MDDALINFSSEEGGAKSPLPRGRLLVGGFRGSSGKTAVTLGLIGAWKNLNVPVTAFKKGPDYIDTAWHAVATGAPCYCLDVFMMGEEIVTRQFTEKCPESGVAIIEGNRGLFDGIDIKGSFSTAEIAKLLDVPVLLVVDITKMTRTSAALVLGCMKLDPDVNIGGVILNRVAGPRHRRIATEAIEDATGLPVLGAIPRLKGISAPERHLGLVTPEETPDAEKWLSSMADAIGPYLDMKRISKLAFSCGGPSYADSVDRPEIKVSGPVKIGVIRDSAFPFYYAENLEALERSGAEIVGIKAVDDDEIPDVDALYIGGGFPETHAQKLSGNDRFRQSLKDKVKNGLPVYAECGGSVYLGRTLRYKGGTYRMGEIIPLDFEFCERPQGHGYTEWTVEKKNPFYEIGAKIRGHEFHYTKAVEFMPEKVSASVRVDRGTGFGESLEGIVVNNVFAMYGHVHALGCEEWVTGMINAALRYKEGR